jgi:hypothetical protein
VGETDHHRRWSRDADYKDAFDALGEEFDLARALIEARTAAGLSQSQLAKKMNASADCPRTTRFTLVRRWRAGSIPICGRRGWESNHNPRSIAPVQIAAGDGAQAAPSRRKTGNVCDAPSERRSVADEPERAAGEGIAFW